MRFCMFKVHRFITRQGSSPVSIPLGKKMLFAGLRFRYFFSEDLDPELSPQFPIRTSPVRRLSTYNAGKKTKTHIKLLNCKCLFIVEIAFTKTFLRHKFPVICLRWIQLLEEMTTCLHASMIACIA